ncbi:DUF397 domain-containing protein [Glycomyces sp. NRRL B-16210]|uniref:DUF397 domain-containing protein n=1 Tax=Glycomyces sp. NRRL B-16210 TaxID=1463821 RepID=UPI0004BE9E50|nr:DUF397 domain-containing protein [Glycomyces sp. NRRL B-16210]
MFDEKHQSPRFQTACESSTCVEVASFANLVLVRDSKDPEGPVLSFSQIEWQEFIAGVKQGVFDFA